MEILILGSDARSAELCEIMIQEGCNARLSSRCEGIFDVLILPLPASRDGVHVSGTDVTLDEVAKKCRGKRVLHGAAPQSLTDALGSDVLFDYNASEQFQYDNARLTVEGALAILIESTRVSIFGSEIAIVGFGRIARLLADALHSLGARVHIYARRESDIAYAHSRGYMADYISSGFDFSGAAAVFNTAPVRLFPDDTLIATECPIIDLAPKSGLAGNGIISAPAIPSRYSPASAAYAVYRSIIHKIKEV